MISCLLICDKLLADSKLEGALIHNTCISPHTFFLLAALENTTITHHHSKNFIVISILGVKSFYRWDFFNRLVSLISYSECEWLYFGSKTCGVSMYYQ